MSENLSRRRFLCHLTVLGAAALLPATKAGAGDPPQWVSVGLATKFTQGHFVQVSLNDSNVVFITRNADNTYLALSGYCTHKGCLVGWEDRSHQFVCPCHKGRFDQAGRNVGGPPQHPLPAYQTRVETNGTLSVLPTAS